MAILNGKHYHDILFCAVCTGPLGVDYDGEKGLADPRAFETIDGGMRCGTCNQPVHNRCADETDVCNPCWEKQRWSWEKQRGSCDNVTRGDAN